MLWRNIECASSSMKTWIGLERGLPGHAVESVPRIGWAGTRNGILLKQAEESGFEAESRPRKRGALHEILLAPRF